MGNVLQATSYIDVHEAARSGHIEHVRRWVDEGKPVDARDNTQKTPLHHAAQWGQEETLDFLIECGAHVDAADFIEDTPLHFACYFGHVSCTRILLKAGADVGARDCYGNTPHQIFDDHVSEPVLDEIRSMVRKISTTNRAPPLEQSESCASDSGNALFRTVALPSYPPPGVRDLTGIQERTDQEKVSPEKSLMTAENSQQPAGDDTRGQSLSDVSRARGTTHTLSRCSQKKRHRQPQTEEQDAMSPRLRIGSSTREGGVQTGTTSSPLTVPARANDAPGAAPPPLTVKLPWDEDTGTQVQDNGAVPAARTADAWRAGGAADTAGTTPAAASGPEVSPFRNVQRKVCAMRSGSTDPARSDGTCMMPSANASSASRNGSMVERGGTAWGSRASSPTTPKRPGINGASLAGTLLIYATKPGGKYDVFAAARDGQVSVLKQALSEGQGVDVRDENGLSSLMWAARTGRLSTAKYLVSQGASLTMRDDTTGFSALHFAAYYCRSAVVRLLVLAGADTKATDNREKVPGKSYQPLSYFSIPGFHHRRLIRRFLTGDLEDSMDDERINMFPMNAPLEAYDEDHKPQYVRLGSSDNLASSIERSSEERDQEERELASPTESLPRPSVCGKDATQAKRVSVHLPHTIHTTLKVVAGGVANDDDHDHHSRENSFHDQRVRGKRGQGRGADSGLSERSFTLSAAKSAMMGGGKRGDSGIQYTPKKIKKNKDSASARTDVERRRGKHNNGESGRSRVPGTRGSINYYLRRTSLPDLPLLGKAGKVGEEAKGDGVGCGEGGSVNAHARGTTPSRTADHSENESPLDVISNAMAAAIAAATSGAASLAATSLSFNKEIVDASEKVTDIAEKGEEEICDDLDNVEAGHAGESRTNRTDNPTHRVDIGGPVVGGRDDAGDGVAEEGEGEGEGEGEKEPRKAVRGEAEKEILAAVAGRVDQVHSTRSPGGPEDTRRRNECSKRGRSLNSVSVEAGDQSRAKVSGEWLSRDESLSAGRDPVIMCVPQTIGSACSPEETQAALRPQCLDGSGSGEVSSPPRTEVAVVFTPAAVASQCRVDPEGHCGSGVDGECTAMLPLSHSGGRDPREGEERKREKEAGEQAMARGLKHPLHLNDNDTYTTPQSKTGSKIEDSSVLSGTSTAVREGGQVEGVTCAMTETMLADGLAKTSVGDTRHGERERRRQHRRRHRRHKIREVAGTERTENEREIIDEESDGGGSGSTLHRRHHRCRPRAVEAPHLPPLERAPSPLQLSPADVSGGRPEGVSQELMSLRASDKGTGPDKGQGALSETSLADTSPPRESPSAQKQTREEARKFGDFLQGQRVSEEFSPPSRNWSENHVGHVGAVFTGKDKGGDDHVGGDVVEASTSTYVDNRGG